MNSVNFHKSYKGESINFLNQELAKKLDSLLKNAARVGNFVSHAGHIDNILNKLCFWTLSIVWCLKNKQN
jgi:hypothetical protein